MRWERTDQGADTEQRCCRGFAIFCVRSLRGLLCAHPSRCRGVLVQEDLWEESKASCGNLHAEPVLGLGPGVVSSELKVFPLDLRAELIIMG